MDHLVAIDPLALILRSDIYVKLTLPDPPPELSVGIREIAKGMGAQEKQAALARVRALSKYCAAMEKELAAR